MSMIDLRYWLLLAAVVAPLGCVAPPAIDESGEVVRTGHPKLGGIIAFVQEDAQDTDLRDSGKITYIVSISPTRDSLKYFGDFTTAEGADVSFEIIYAYATIMQSDVAVLAKTVSGGERAGTEAILLRWQHDAWISQPIRGVSRRLLPL